MKIGLPLVLVTIILAPESAKEGGEAATPEFAAEAAAAYDAAVEAALGQSESLHSTPFECTGHCTECGISSSYHKLYIVPIGWKGTHQDEPFSCADAPCPTGCGDPEEEDTDLLDAEKMAVLWDAVRLNTMDEILEALRGSDRVQFNQDRLAIQVEGWGGAIVAHIPLSYSQVGEISSFDK